MCFALMKAGSNIAEMLFLYINHVDQSIDQHGVLYIYLCNITILKEEEEECIIMMMIFSMHAYHLSY